MASHRRDAASDGPRSAELHDRMPLIPEQPDWPTSPGETDAGSLFHRSPSGTARVWPTARALTHPKSLRSSRPQHGKCPDFSCQTG
jgi:hypothetical protein